MFHREAGCSPLGVAVLEPGSFEAMSAKLGHCLVGQHAVGSATVRNDLLIARQFTEAALEIAQGDIECAWDMTCVEFLLGPGVDDGYQPLSNSA